MSAEEGGGGCGGLGSRWVEAIVLTGLAGDAFVHFHLGPHSSTTREHAQGADLFHLEAIAAVAAAVALLVRPRR